MIRSRPPSWCRRLAGVARRSHNVVYETALYLMDLAKRELLLQRKIGKAFVAFPVPDLAGRLRGG
ncbi:MAG: hypothetical protein WDA27_12680 [Actinomycetota bacterium]